MYPLKFHVILLFLLSMITNELAQDGYLTFKCPNTTTFAKNSTYDDNRNLLLSYLSSNDSRLKGFGFYNASAGQDPDDVYGYYLCRGDMSTDDCQQCVNNATKDIVKHCPYGKEAIIWYDPCFLCYSSQSIFSKLDQKFVLIWKNEQNVTDQLYFDDQVKSAMTLTATDKVLKSANMFAAVNYYSTSTSQTLYYLLQCTPYLSYPDCYTCLTGAIDELRNYYFSNRRGGRFLSPSCNIRYELYLFYHEGTSEVAPRPSPPPVLPPPPVPGSETRPKGGGDLTWLKVSGSILAVIVTALLCYCTYTVWKRNPKRDEKDNIQEVQLLDFVDGNHNQNIQGEKPVESQDFPLIKLDIVYKATNHFSNENKLGEGGFGPVYKGTFEDGKEIAVKRLSRSSGQGLIEFMNEVTLIARLQHKNLVRLLGCCLEKNEKILIYEYMPNKSLDLFIFDSSMAVQLDWQRRLSIINGIARGLLYLHEDSRLKIIHRDLKTSNILLDYEMNPKISDFGMARIFGGNQNEANTKRIVGTYGYMSPEYAMEGLFSAKSDIFSFGVIVLEIISGKRNNGFCQSRKGESLLTYAWKLWSNMQGLELMNPLLAMSSVAAEVLKCIHIALLCVQDDPADRPIMSSVGVMLASDNISLPVPSQPAVFVGRVVAGSSQSSDDKVCSVNEATMSNVSPR